MPPSDRLVLRNVTLISGRDTLARRVKAIVIKSGRLERLCISDRHANNRRMCGGVPGDSIIDLEWAWVIPGLIDAHAHIGFNELLKPATPGRTVPWLSRVRRAGA